MTATLPAGWKLAPIEPTDDMETAAENDYEQRGETFPDWKAKYRAMLAAAPTPPAIAPDDTLARKGNTTKEQEMYAAGIDVGRAIERENAAVAGGVQDDAKDERSRVMEVIAGVWDRGTQIDDAADEVIDLLRAPAAGDALDAARYRWLRDPKTDPALVLDKRTGYVPEDESVPGVGGYHTYEYRAGEELDAAIDAAIAAIAQQKGEA